MRRATFLLLSAVLSTAVFAQSRPPKLEPLPEAPPPPTIRDGADDPRVVIQGPQQGDKVEEVREGGRVVMMKVTPPNGIPYYLLDTLGTGNWTRTDSLDPGVRVPMWSIKQFD
jgi:hypothetical protein